MAYPTCPLFNCCSSTCQPPNNPYSGCSLVAPPSCCSPNYSSKCPGILAKFVNGHGDLSCGDEDPCCPKPRPKRCCPPPLPPRQCCPAPQKKLQPCPRPACCPPAVIQTRCKPPPGRNPSERLRNVDVHEELCYYVPGDGGSNDNYNCYALCNCCGSPEPVPCPCPCPGPPNPVKYNRRQRFTFEEEQGPRGGRIEDGPCWPFERPFQHQNPEGVAGCCGPHHPQNQQQQHRRLISDITE